MYSRRVGGPLGPPAPGPPAPGPLAPLDRRQHVSYK